MYKFPFLILFIAGLGCAAEEAIPHLPALPGTCEQVLRVTASIDTTPHATLQRYARTATTDWQPIGAPIPVTLGRNGLGWGRGLHRNPDATSIPRKREGDGKSPLGIFTLGTAFGAAERLDTRLPYLQLTDLTECIDDATHPRYNQLLTDTLPRRDWSSSERMLAVGERYEFGVFVDHNTPATPRRGSCIFLHVWGGPDVPTSGCTAMARADLLDLLSWLDPAREPLLVQTTEAVLTSGKLELATPDQTSQPADPTAPVVIPEERIAAFLREDQVSGLATIDRKYRQFLYEAHDLNGDGRPEYLVTFQNPYFCGSGGCNLLILNDDFSLKNRLTVVRKPLYLGPRNDDGWRDLVIFSDVQSCQNRPHLLTYEAGYGYPSNPSVAPCTEQDLTEMTSVFDLERTGEEFYEF